MRKDNKNKKPIKGKPEKEDVRKQVLTRIVEQTDSSRERVYRIDFSIPEYETGWMWLATIGDRKKAKRIAQMCREGHL